MADDAGNLSIDFLAGFTIFILAFIWVASMIPGILIGLQSNTIDYDAVAYRTGVILVEDPGYPSASTEGSWESFTDGRKFSISRFGLAISKNSPGILSREKVNRFFCVSTTDPNVGFVYPDDYRSRAVFGDYPYHFNISITDLEDNQNRKVGDVLPDGYGYIRRLVKIKEGSNTTIGTALINKFHYNNTANVTQHEFSVLINTTKLSGDMSTPAYQIDPSSEQIIINITDLRSTIKEFDPDATYPTGISRATSNITLTKIAIYTLNWGGGLSTVYSNITSQPYIDGSSTVTAPPCGVNDNISLIINPRVFFGWGSYTRIYINYTFTVDPKSTFLNNTNNGRTQPFDYNYFAENVTQPRLKDAVMEVAVWE